MASTATDVSPPEGDAVEEAIPVGDRMLSVIDAARRAGVPLLIAGATGIGKSEIIEQYARQRGIAVKLLHLTQLEPPDLVGLPYRKGGRTLYAPPAALPRDGEGILVLEELNRADALIRAAIFELLTSRRIHQYVLPPGWMLAATINPPAPSYQVHPLDPALRDRFLQVSACANREDWLAWAKSRGIAPEIIAIARENADVFAAATPRMWTRIARIIATLSQEERRDEALIRHLLRGSLAPAWIESVLSHIADADAMRDLDPYAVLCDYHRNDLLRRKVMAAIEAGRTDLIDLIIRHVARIPKPSGFDGTARGRSFRPAAFEALLADLSGDLREKLEDAFAGNPFSLEALGVDPKGVLTEYRGSNLEAAVREWAKSPNKRYRIRALIAGLRRLIERGQPSISKTLSSQKVHANLGALLAAVGDEMARPLAAALASSGIEPTGTTREEAR
ncbi:MAG: AAA family ATPase [Planctomycetes bacterium]|nr:AAA family ATPase [Planctomycetota bacterium]